MFGCLRVLPRSFALISVWENTKRHISLFGGPMFIKVSPYLYAEPLKKKKRIDPAILKAREEKKKKKLEKQIRRLEKNAKQLKPLEELQVSWKLLDEKKIRERHLPALTEKEIEERYYLFKEWSQYKFKQHAADLQLLDKLICSQQKALQELRLESEELYKEAVEIESNFLPFKVKGPVNTPPNPSYDSPDGEYIDVSKKWD